MPSQCVLETVRPPSAGANVSGPDYLVTTSVRIVPVKKERQTSSNSNQGQSSMVQSFMLWLTLVVPPQTDDSEDVNATGAEAKGAKRRRSTVEIEADPNRRLNPPYM